MLAVPDMQNVSSTFNRVIFLCYLRWLCSLAHLDAAKINKYIQMLSSIEKIFCILFLQLEKIG